jgi:hypothetical protein
VVGDVVKTAKIVADNGDEVGVEVSEDGTVILSVRPDVPARHAVKVELDEVTAASFADALGEARRNAVMNASARRNGIRL